MDINTTEGIPKRVTFSVKDSAGLAVDLTGAVLSSSCEINYIKYNALCSIVDPLNGVCEAVYPALPAGSGKWDAFLCIGDASRMIAKGKIKVTSRITPDCQCDAPQNMYADVILGDGEDYEVVVTMDEQPTELSRSYADQSKGARDESLAIKGEVTDLKAQTVDAKTDAQSACSLANSYAISAGKSSAKATLEADRVDGAVASIGDNVEQSAINAGNAQRSAEVAHEAERGAVQASTTAGSHSIASAESASESAGSALTASQKAELAELARIKAEEAKTLAQEAQRLAELASDEAVQAVASINEPTIARTDRENVFSQTQTIDLNYNTSFINQKICQINNIPTSNCDFSIQINSSGFVEIISQQQGTGNLYTIYFRGNTSFRDCSATRMFCANFQNNPTFFGVVTFNQKVTLTNGATTPDPVIPGDVVPKSYVDGLDGVTHFVIQKLYFDNLTTGYTLFRGDKSITRFDYYLPIAENCNSMFMNSGLEGDVTLVIPKATVITNIVAGCSNLKKVTIKVDGTATYYLDGHINGSGVTDYTFELLLQESRIIRTVSCFYSNTIIEKVSFDSSFVTNASRCFYNTPKLAEYPLIWPSLINGHYMFFETNMTREQLDTIINGLPNRKESGEYVNNYIDPSINNSVGVITLNCKYTTSAPTPSEWQYYANRIGWTIILRDNEIYTPV